MSRARFTSNSGIFAKRGDPWISRKEGVKDFGRNPETEDAEYDFDHRFHKSGSAFGKPTVAKAKPEYRDPKPEPKDDLARRKANVLRVMNKKMNEHTSRLTAVEPRTSVFKPCAGCRKAICISKRMCQK